LLFIVRKFLKIIHFIGIQKLLWLRPAVDAIHGDEDLIKSQTSTRETRLFHLC